MNTPNEQVSWVEQGQTFFTSHLFYLIAWEWKYFTKKLGMGFTPPHKLVLATMATLILHNKQLNKAAG